MADLIKTYQDYCEPLKGSAKFHKWSMLSCIGALMERKTWSSIGGLGNIYPNMFIVLCGPPGTGKTVSSNMAVSFVKHFNRGLSSDSPKLNFGPDKITPAALIKRFVRCNKTINDIPLRGTQEQSCMFMHSTELSTFIKDIGGGSMSDDLLKLYDNDDYFEKELVGEGIITVVNPGLNMLVDTTPSFLSSFLPREESGTGLTARMIFVTETSRVDMDLFPPMGDPTLAALIMQEIDRIYRIKGPFDTEPKAVDFFEAWYKKHQVQIQTMQPGSFMENFYARKVPHLRKVAMCLSASRSSERLIRLRDIENALSSINELETTMGSSFGVQDFKSIKDLNKLILNVMPLGRKVTKAEILKALFASGASGELSYFDNNMQTLLAMGMVKETRTDKEHTFFKGE